MKRLVRPGLDFEERYPSDLDRIVRVVAEAGYEIDRQTAQWAWEEYSDHYAAGWLSLDSYSDYEILFALQVHCDVEGAET